MGVNFQIFKFSNFQIIIIATTLLISCNSTKPTLSKEEFEKQIKEQETKLFSSANKIYDTETAISIVKLYSDFAAAYPEDKGVPDYLYKAGEVAISLKKYTDAINYLKQVADNYSDYEKSSYCLFLQAFVYDNHINDDAKAGELYRAFIQKYPKNPLVKDAEFSIQNLGKSDEQLIREFEAKQKSSTD